MIIVWDNCGRRVCIGTAFEGLKWQIAWVVLLGVYTVVVHCIPVHILHFCRASTRHCH